MSKQQWEIATDQIVEAMDAEPKAAKAFVEFFELAKELCLLYTSPSPRDRQKSRMPSSA